MAGKRMPIKLTRALVNAALSGALKKSEFVQETVFGLWIPVLVDGVDALYLNPEPDMGRSKRIQEDSRRSGRALPEKHREVYQSSGIGSQRRPPIRSWPGREDTGCLKLQNRFWGSAHLKKVSHLTLHALTRTGRQNVNHIFL